MSDPLPSNILRALHRPSVYAEPAPPRPRLPLPQPVQPTPALAEQGGGETPGASCPLVCIEHRRVRLFDVDAKWAAVKDVLDGLVYAGLLHGDKEGQIDLKVCQTKVKTYAEEETVITIAYL